MVTRTRCSVIAPTAAWTDGGSSCAIRALLLSACFLVFFFFRGHAERTRRLFVDKVLHFVGRRSFSCPMSTYQSGWKWYYRIVRFLPGTSASYTTPTVLPLKCKGPLFFTRYCVYTPTVLTLKCKDRLYFLVYTIHANGPRVEMQGPRIVVVDKPQRSSQFRPERYCGCVRVVLSNRQ